MKPTEELLRQLAASDERCVRVVLSGERSHDALNRVTRALVQLGALIALDAPTTSLRWAADAASTAGADDAALVEVLLTAGSATGAAQTVVSAPRLALALDLDVEGSGES